MGSLRPGRGVQTRKRRRCGAESKAGKRAARARTSPIRAVAFQRRARQRAKTNQSNAREPGSTKLPVSTVTMSVPVKNCC